nr:hypothetical protein [Deltaproteobacteria bacterium]
SALTQTAPVTFATKYPNIRLRKSLGPISESMVLDSGALEAAAQTILANTGAFLIVPYAATNLTYEYGYYSPVKLEWLIPTGYSYTNAPGTMVTRRLGRGS